MITMSENLFVCTKLLFFKRGVKNRRSYRTSSLFFWLVLLQPCIARCGAFSSCNQPDGGHSELGCCYRAPGLEWDPLYHTPPTSRADSRICLHRPYVLLIYLRGRVVISYLLRNIRLPQKIFRCLNSSGVVSSNHCRTLSLSRVNQGSARTYFGEWTQVGQGIW